MNMFLYLKQQFLEKREKQTFQKGFTLIELLASTVVIVTVGVIIVAIIISALRGTNKTNTLTTARQNGTYATSQIAKMLRFARSINTIGTRPPSVCITNKPLPSPQPTPGVFGNSDTSITFTDENGSVTTIACVPLANSTALTIASMSGSLPNPLPNTVSGSLLDTRYVQIPSGKCVITCNQSTSSDAMIVGVTFSLEAVKPTGTLFSEFTLGASQQEFTTSVILRNLGR
jgi:type II secretory pathway pseudopilin PulG